MFKCISLNADHVQYNNKTTKWIKVKAHSMACAEVLRLACQVLKCPCQVKWRISGHLAFLPSHLAGACCVLMTLSASCQVSWGVIWGKSPVEGWWTEKCHQGSLKELCWDFVFHVCESCVGESLVKWCLNHGEGWTFRGLF